ncbi:YggS family pyridoxal phosphate-dependent enzyme [Reichenbachiella ulvae]|uniref:Pyridoxal phosphate homeostasis protein n=1 Tax=Reichenbachiella ulvae TaxID=2980104 RepID=A0ABT3CPW9_9BACT|nr:YggS family pyridoxal phosphate-dependent enzyme [Reichenbachiella ulvae]MCV9385500.1 YggS family pyridoxal phosphate-dependent enzyme [Reichenbachiella ulvae]
MGSDIAGNIQAIREELKDTQAQLIAVSKTKPNEAIEEAYAAGQRVFGENKVQELVDKYESLPKDIQWHMIGHLQRNKVKYIAPFVHLIHGVDSLKLLKEINKQGKKVDRIVPCLLQVHIAQEETKFGFDIAELKEMLDNKVLDDLTHVEIQGLMGMATNTEDEKQVAQEFAGLKSLKEELDKDYQHPRLQLKELSMGMSGDYPLALANGSTMIRVGSTIFGARNYNT